MMHQGNCNDCHGEDATGDFTRIDEFDRKDLYLCSDRASILDSINRDVTESCRHSRQVEPEEIKAVSVYVFSRAAK